MALEAAGVEIPAGERPALSHPLPPPPRGLPVNTPARALLGRPSPQAVPHGAAGANQSHSCH